jgi:hypothetical protein
MRPLLLILLIAACARSKDTPPAPSSWANAEVGLIVQNHNWSDVRIYVVHDGVSERIGLVTAASVGTFILPGRYFASQGGIRLQAYAIAGDQPYTTETLTLHPGDAITWTLESRLDHSSILIR